MYKEKEQHELHDCPHRWVNQEMGGGTFKLSEMKDMEETCENERLHVHIVKRNVCR